MTDHNASQDQTALRPDLMLDFANDTLDVEDRITVARVLADQPQAAAETFRHIAEREELLLALGLRKVLDDYPTLPGPLPTAPEPKAFSKMAVGFGFGISLASVVLVAGLTLLPFGTSPRAGDDLIGEALRANALAELRLNMVSMDEDTSVDLAEIKRLAGLSLPGHPATWVLRDTQVIPSDSGASVLMTFDAGADGMVTLYVAQAQDDAPHAPSRLTLADGRGAWFRHGGADYVLIGRQARDPLDDDATQLMASFTPA